MQHKIPDMDMQDGAMLERLLFIPHRSRFYKQGEVPAEPYSYAADPNIKLSFVRWGPYFLQWLLEGLRKYKEEGFRNIPDSCLAFKNQLLEAQDDVKEYLDEQVQEGAASDFVKAKDMWDEFEDRNRHKRKKRSKPYMSYKKFRENTERLLKKKITERYKFTQNGKQEEESSVVLGYRKV